MNLGIVTPKVSLHDGQGHVNREIVVEALRRGHAVKIFAESVDPGAVEENGAQFLLSRPPTWLPSRLLRDQLLAVRTRSEISRAANACDALLANGFVTWAHSDINAVHFVHDAWVRSSYHPWRLKRDARTFYARTYNTVNAFLERQAFQRARRLVAVSNSVKDDLIRVGVPESRITVISNGVDTTEFCPGAPQRQIFGLPEAVPIALFAGDLRSVRKNLDTVLRAMVYVPGLHLAVAGRHENTVYPELVEKMGLQERVHFVGFRRDMSALMRSVDLFVFPSRYEACSLVLLEALASGLPVVTARSTGGCELLGPPSGIVLEDSEDAVELARALDAIATADASRRMLLREHAVSTAQRNAWSSMACRYVDLLEQAARERTGATSLQ